VEIILAIGLATALLLVAMTFYHQAAEMRVNILRESERVSMMRLVVDRLAGDLRAAQPKAGPGNEFTGDSTSMSFIKEACASSSPYTLPGAAEPTDLVRISVATLTGTNGSKVVVSGLDRVEALVNPPAAPLALPTNAVATSPDLLTNTASTSLYPADPTNTVTEPFAPIIRFVRFRYWDGAAWQGGWTNATPPAGVEMVLSTDGLEEDAEPDAYPPEAFRRVVFVPGGVPRPGSDVGVSTNSAAL